MSINKNDLSEREQEILRLLATGASNKEIAQHLFISPNTVKVHLRNIYEKMGVNTRTEAAMSAVNSGLVSNQPLQDQEILKLAQREQSQSENTFSQETWQTLRPLDRWIKNNQRLMTASGILFFLIVIAVIIFSYRSLNEISRSNASQTETATARKENPLWGEKAKMMTPRSHFGIVAYQNRIFTFAGADSSGVTGIVEQYDIVKNKWSRLKDKPLKVEGIQAAIIGDLAYVPGGKMEDGRPTDILEVYKIEDSTWSRKANLPEPSANYALAVIAGKIFLFGGWDGIQYSDSIFEYDPDLDEWKSDLNLSVARDSLSAVAIDRNVYVFGGFDGKQALDVFEVFHLDADGELGLSKLPSKMPEKVFGMGATSLLDIVYVIGGKSDLNRNYPILVYYTNTGEWQSIKVPAEYRIGSYLGVTGSGQYLYLMGGTQDDRIIGDHLSYKAIITTSLPLITR